MRRSVLAAVVAAVLPALLPLCAGHSVDPAGFWWFAPPFRAQAPASLLHGNWAIHDRCFSYAPWMRYLALRAHEGAAPLWNPSIHLGVPFFSNPQTALLYPPQWIFAALPPAAAWPAYFALHFALAALGAYALMRALACSRLASACGAMAFAHCGFIQVWIGTSSGAAACWLPALLAASVTLRARPSHAAWLALAAATALCLLAGSPQIAALALGLVVLETRSRHALAAIACGALLAAPHVLPTLAYLADSHALAERAARPVNEFTLPLSAAVHLVSPRVLGFPPGEYFGQLAFVASVGLYGGALALASALLTLVVPSDHPAITRLRLAWVASLVLTFGLCGTPRIVARLPVLGGIRLYYAGLVTALATAALASIGLDAALTAPAGRRAPWLIGLASVALLAPGLAALAAPDATQRALDRLAGALVSLKRGPLEMAEDEIRARARRLVEPGCGLPDLALVGAGGLAFALALAAARRSPRARPALAALIALEGALTWSSFHAMPPGDPAAAPAPVVARARELAGPSRCLAVGGWSPNLGCVFGLTDLRGYDAVMPESLHRYLAAIDPAHAGIFQNVRLEATAGPLLDEASIGIIWATAPGQAPPGLEPLEPGIWRRPTALPRARIAPGTTSVAGPDEALRALADPARRPGSTATWVPRPGVTPPDGTGAGTCRLTQDDPEELTIAAEVHGRAWLVLADQYLPGWTCTLDGAPAAIECVNVCMRGVMLPEGAHTVRFSYRPAGVFPGLALAALGACLALSAAAGRRSSPSSPACGAPRPPTCTS